MARSAVQYNHSSSEVRCNWLTPPFFPSRTGVWPLPAHINPREERRRWSKPLKAKSLLRSSLPSPPPPAPPALLNPLYTKCVSIQPLFHQHFTADDDDQVLLFAIILRVLGSTSQSISQNGELDKAKRTLVYRLAFKKTSFDPRKLP